MSEVRRLISRPAALCFESFCDVRHLRSWTPGIRKATAVRVDPKGRAIEVLFEVGETLTYSLHYRYDDQARRLEWWPGLGARDAVRGSAEFHDTAPGACEIVYVLELQSGRQGEDSLASAETLVSAFARWMEHGPR